MFTKTTAIIILTIFCFTQAGFAAPFKAQNLRTEAAAQGKFKTKVGEEIVSAANQPAAAAGEGEVVLAGATGTRIQQVRDEWNKAREEYSAKENTRNEVAREFGVAIEDAKKPSIKEIATIELIYEKISHARDVLLDINLEKAKEIYLEILSLYMALSVKEQKRVYEAVKELYDERKVYGSCFFACRNAHLSEQEAEEICKKICIAMTKWVKTKKVVSSNDIFKILVQELKKHDEDAAFLYETHRDIS